MNKIAAIILSVVVVAVVAFLISKFADKKFWSYFIALLILILILFFGIDWFRTGVVGLPNKLSGN